MTVKEAAIKMRDGDFGVLPIHENDRLIGIVTDRDLTVRALAAGKDPDATTLRDVMSPEILYCYEDQTIDEVARNMGEQQVRRLPVVSRSKRLVGILSLGDLALTNTNADEVEEALCQISRPQQDAPNSFLHF